MNWECFWKTMWYKTKQNVIEPAVLVLFLVIIVGGLIAVAAGITVLLWNLETIVKLFVAGVLSGFVLIMVVVTPIRAIIRIAKECRE